MGCVFLPPRDKTRHLFIFERNFGNSESGNLKNPFVNTSGNSKFHLKVGSFYCHLSHWVGVLLIDIFGLFGNRMVSYRMIMFWMPISTEGVYYKKNKRRNVTIPSSPHEKLISEKSV
jgi:hypothetical protein